MDRRGDPVEPAAGHRWQKGTRRHRANISSVDCREHGCGSGQRHGSASLREPQLAEFQGHQLVPVAPFKQHRGAAIADALHNAGVTPVDGAGIPDRHRRARQDGGHGIGAGGRGRHGCWPWGAPIMVQRQRVRTKRGWKPPECGRPQSGESSRPWRPRHAHGSPGSRSSPPGATRQTGPSPRCW